MVMLQLEMMRQKHLVQLDWVSTEDGSHILTVAVGSRIMMYAQVSNDIVQESKKGEPDSKPPSGTMNLTETGTRTPFSDRPAGRRALLQKSKSMVMEDYQEVLQWMKLRTIELTTADGLPPLPMHISWVRGGILVVGMDNEMHVYSQWRYSQNPGELAITDTDRVDGPDERSLDDKNYSTLDLTREAMMASKKSLPSIKSSISVPNFKKFASGVFRKDTSRSSANLRKKSGKTNLEKTDSTLSLNLIHELGLFEAAHQASPVLPQYHPKSLMELLYFGKVRRVKAILAHLVRCIAGRTVHPVTNVDDINLDDNRLYKQRTMSVSQPSPGDAPLLNEDVTLDYVEITSIPLLPLYSLLAADSDTSQPDISAAAQSGQEKLDYKDLFNTNVMDEEELNTDVLSSSGEERTRLARSVSATGITQNPFHFSASQASLLGKHLTHMHLPDLSGQDQMYLLALADTVAHTKSDFADSFEPHGTAYLFIDF